MTKTDVIFWSITLAYTTSSILFFLLIRRETEKTKYWMNKYAKALDRIRELEIPEVEELEDWELEGEEWKDV